MALRLRINRVWILLLLAVGLGVAAVFLSLQYLKTREQRLESDLKQRAKGGPTVAVVVPMADAPKGTMLSGETVVARDIQADLLYPDMVTADQFSMIEGKRLLRPVERGRPLRREDVLDDRADLSAMLDKGRRAITLDIDEFNSIAQMVRPGNKLDLYLIVPESTGGQEIVTFLQGVKVLAAGQATKSPEPGTPEARNFRYGTVTFDLDPDDAARLALAQQFGRIRMVLRSGEDAGEVMLSRINTKNIFRAVRFAPQKPSAPTPTSPEIDLASVEYIIGGRGGATAAPLNVPMPAGVPNLMPTQTPGGPASIGLPGSAGATPGTTTLTGPGGVKLTYPSDMPLTGTR